jgi:hypothetical protein
VRVYTEEQKERNRAYYKIWYVKNREAKKEYRKRRYAENREFLCEQAKQRYESNHKTLREQAKQRYERNRKIVLKQVKQYYEKNRKTRLKYAKQYRENNREIIREKMRLWMTKAKKNNLGFKLKCRIYTRINELLKGIEKSIPTMKLVGCYCEWLKAWLEIHFQPGMTWGNYGLSGWHIDHIKPCEAFDLTDPYQQRLCNNWRNLQPMWASENISKGDKWSPEQEIWWRTEVMGLAP